MGGDNPYTAEVIAARQRISRLKDRLAQRSAARRSFLSDKDDLPGPPSEGAQVSPAATEILKAQGTSLSLVTCT